MPSGIINTVKKEWKKALWVAFFGMIFLAALKTAHAQGYLGEGWDQFLPSGLQQPRGEGTGEQFAIQLVKNFVRIARYIVGGVALITGGLYAMAFVFARGQEEKITQAKQNFLWMLMGFLILIISENLANILNPERATSDQIIDFSATRDQFRDIVDYLKWILGSITVLMMTISGLRLVISGSEEEEITKQKRNFAWGLIGMLLILLANNIVNAIYLIKSPKEFGAPGPEKAITEISSVIKLILVFLGPLAIAFTLYAGFVYLTAMDNEDRSKQGKQMIIGGITGIVLIYASYALVNTITAETFTWTITSLFA